MMNQAAPDRLCIPVYLPSWNSRRSTAGGSARASEGGNRSYRMMDAETAEFTSSRPAREEKENCYSAPFFAAPHTLGNNVNIYTFLFICPFYLFVQGLGMIYFGKHPSGRLVGCWLVNCSVIFILTASSGGDI